MAKLSVELRCRFPLLALCLVVAHPSQAQETNFVVGGPYGGGYACDRHATITTLSWVQTIQNAEGRLLVVSVVTPLGNVTSVTFNGLPLTQKAVAVNDVVDPSVNATGVQAEIWYLVNPPVGTFSIAVGLATPVASIAGVSAQYSKVDQAAPLGDAVTTVAGPSATSVSLSVLNTVSTSYKRGLVIDAVGLERLGGMGRWDAGANQTQRSFQRMCARRGAAISEEPSNGGTVTMSGSGYADYRIAHVAVEVRPAEKKSTGTSPAELKAVPVSLVNAEVQAGRVSLRWFSSLRYPGIVYRRAKASEWKSRGEAQADGAGMLSFSELVAAGDYEYRLGLMTSAAEVLSDVVSVEVLPIALTLEPITPNPLGTRDLIVSFTLPSSAAATLELLDVSGRRLASSEVGSLGPGRHSVTLARFGTVKPGIFLVRLMQSGHTVSRTAALLH